MTELFIGLMSGTSLDGVDGVLVDFAAPHLKVVAHASAGLDAGLRQELLALNEAGANELHRAALAANALVRVYAQVSLQLLTSTATPSAQVRAIGAHGQTVRHQPQAFDGNGYSLQINNPALLAELTGIDVVADFRSRDLAAGGQGAPLVPVFHQMVFAHLGATVAVLNLGGISNLTVLTSQPRSAVLGFDCGPGNVLLDAWCQHHRDLPFDAAGAWAAAGRVHTGLLAALLTEPYFQRGAPKSTGRERFNLPWLQRRLESFPSLTPVDVQATLVELTASVCAADVLRYAAGSQELVLCGGGACNEFLLQRLQALLPGLRVASSQQHGLAPLAVEAAAFAWLARQHVRAEPINLQSVTGASAPRRLGALYPA